MAPSSCRRVSQRERNREEVEKIPGDAVIVIPAGECMCIGTPVASVAFTLIFTNVSPFVFGSGWSAVLLART